jgi:hypothetical protein
MEIVLFFLLSQLLDADENDGKSEERAWQQEKHG